MRNTMLVASREYAENARTKGFWIGILIFPIMLVGVIFVTKWLAEDATPTRHYIVVDKAGPFGERLDERMDLRYAAKAFRDYQSWVQKNLKEEHQTAVTIDYENMPPMDMKDFDAEQFLEAFIANNPGELERALEPGGFDDLIATVRPKLKEDAGDFEVPRRMFERVPLPDGIEESASTKEIAEFLKPYLKSEKPLEVNGRTVDLFALVIIPDNVERPFAVEGEESGGLISDLTGAVVGPPAVQYWSTNLADTDLSSILS